MNRATQEKVVVRRNMRTPWGSAQTAEIVAPGIGAVSTAGHGGIKLSRERNALVPDYMRQDGGWYEEDCDWALAVLVFPDEFSQWAGDSRDVESAHSTAKNWRPDKYERFTGRKLKSSEWAARRRKLFFELNAERWIVFSAVLDDERPDMVKCWASIGGIRTGKERRFLIPSAEYDTRSFYGFAIEDPAAYEEL